MNFEKKDFFFFNSFAFLIILLIPFSLIVDGAGFVVETVTTKVYLFRFLVIAASFSVLFSLLFSIWKNKTQNLVVQLKHPLLIAYILFLMTMLASNLLSPRSELSFWSKYSRMDGYWQSIFVFQFLCVLLVVFRTEKHWRYLVYSFLGASWVLFLVLLAQQLGLLTTAEPLRFAATMGNPIYLGYIMAVSFILHTALIFKAQNEKWPWLLFLGSVVCLYSVYWSQSRSVVVALLAAIILAGVIVVFISKSQFKKRALVLFWQIVATGIGIYLANLFLGLNISDRILSYTPTDDSIMTRLQLWNQAWHSFLQKPWLGWGQESFSLATDVLSGLVNEPWQDRVHNQWLEILMSFGVVGFSIYAIFQFFILTSIIRLIKNNLYQNQGLLLLVILVFNSIFNFFVFDFLTSSAVMVVVLGYLIFTDSLVDTKSMFFVPRLYKQIGLLVIPWGLCFQAFNLGKDILDNRQLNAALTQPKLFILDQNQQPQMLLQSLIDKNPNDLQTTLEVMMAVAAQAATEQEQPFYRQLIYQTVDKQIQRQIKTSYQDAKFYMYAGKFYSAFQQSTIARKMFQQSLQLYPNNLEVKQLLSQIKNYQ